MFLNFSTAVDSHGFRFPFFRLLNNVVVNVFEVTRDVGGAADADIVSVDGVARTNQLSGDIDVLQKILNIGRQNLMQVTNIEIEEL